MPIPDPDFEGFDGVYIGDPKTPDLDLSKMQAYDYRAMLKWKRDNGLSKYDPVPPEIAKQFEIH